MMRKVYYLRNKKDRGTKIGLFHESLGVAKRSSRFIVTQKNKKLNKEERVKYSDFEVVECELVEKQPHPI